MVWGTPSLEKTGDQLWNSNPSTIGISSLSARRTRQLETRGGISIPGSAKEIGTWLLRLPTTHIDRQTAQRCAVGPAAGRTMYGPLSMQSFVHFSRCECRYIDCSCVHVVRRSQRSSRTLLHFLAERLSRRHTTRRQSPLQQSADLPTAVRIDAGDPQHTGAYKGTFLSALEKLSVIWPNRLLKSQKVQREIQFNYRDGTNVYHWTRNLSK